MDGHNGSLDNFLLVIWLFLNVCPEAPAINPFLEAKQTHRSNGHASQGSLVDRKDIWAQRGEGSVKSELSSEPFGESHSLLLRQGNEPALSVFLSGIPDKAKESPTQDSTINRKSCHLLLQEAGQELRSATGREAAVLAVILALQVQGNSDRKSSTLRLQP